MRGQRNEPAYVRYVAQTVADLRGVPLEALIQRNGLRSPFDITEGQEILIHDDLA